MELLLHLHLHLHLHAGMDERAVQKNYWIEHTADLSVEAMMLDSKASDLDKEERPEVTFAFPSRLTLSSPLLSKARFMIFSTEMNLNVSRVVLF